MFSNMFGGLNISSWFNYKTVNINNFYNFIYLTLEKATDDDKKTIIKDLKLMVGMEFYTDLIKYIIKKNSSDPLLKVIT